MADAYHQYNRRRWNYILFESCSGECLEGKNIYYDKKRQYENFQRMENDKIAEAKSKLGILSEYGVDETRTLSSLSFSVCQ